MACGAAKVLVRKERSRGGEVGGASPPRLAGRCVPHFSPPCNPNCPLLPTDPARAPVRGAKSPVIAGDLAVGSGGRHPSRNPQDGLRSFIAHSFLRSSIRTALSSKEL